MDKATEEQIKIFMAQELTNGTKLSDIQNMINEKFAANLTYMDVRIMASTLDIDWQKVNPAPAPAPQPETPAAPQAEAAPAALPQEMPAENDPAVPAGEEALPEMPDTSTTIVEISKLARPGMMLSGTVTFANGSSADWCIDQMGRLGVENLKGDKPSQQDIEAFQIKLDQVIRQAMGR